MRAVLDTNVLISSVIATGTPHNIVVKGFSSEYQIIVSVATLTEFRETLLKYPEKFHLTEKEVQQEVETVRYFAEFVDPDEKITAVDDDPDDDKFLEAAVLVALTISSPVTGTCLTSPPFVGSRSWIPERSMT